MSVVKQKPQPPPQSQAQDNTSSSINSKIEELRQKFNYLRAYLNSKVIGHPEMINAVLTGLVAGENVVLIGQPGTAKSLLATTLADAIQGANVFKYLLTKYTDYAELFGAIDVSELSKGIYKRRWSPIVDADIIFLDEIFKANSAILNSLLSLLNEHVVFDTMTGTKQVNAKLVIGASNEVPEEDELKALYDRFPIKVFVSYIKRYSDFEKALYATWCDSSCQDFQSPPPPNVTIQDVVEAQSLVKKLFTTPLKLKNGKVIVPINYYKEVVYSLVSDLRNNGITISDRTIISKLPKLVTAKAILEGNDAVVTSIFDLVPLLAPTPEEQQKAKEIITNRVGTVSEIKQKYELAMDIIRQLKNMSDAEKLAKINEAEQLLTEVLQVKMDTIPDYLSPFVGEIILNAQKKIQQIKELKSRLTEEAEKIADDEL